MSKEGVLTTAGFYGNKNKRKWIGLENSINSVVKKHQSQKIPKSFPLRILGPTTTWQTFYRQQEAFQFCKSTSKELHVFAFESGSFEGNTGQRLYLAASYPVFWHYYSQLDEEKRLHYEVIPEGAVCKLYFDLEYDRSINPDCDGNYMVDIFIKYVCLSLKSTFNLTLTRKDVLDLEASTEKKFSRHLIFQMKKAAFKDNIHAGRFVHSLMSRLLKRIQSTLTGKESLCELIPSKDTQTDTQTDCTHGSTAVSERAGNASVDSDNIVVSQNNSDGSLSVNISVKSCPVRHGREPDQSGKNDNTDKIKETGDKAVDTRLTDKTDNIDEVFASFTNEDLQKLVVKNKNGDDVFFCDTGVYTKNRNFRLFLSSKLGKKNPLLVAEQNEFCSLEMLKQSENENIFYDSLVSNVQYCSGMRILTFEESNLSGNMAGLGGRRKGKHSQEPECLDGFNKSPYPEVDEYISSIIVGHSGKGVIRHWTYFHQGELLVYEIGKYRYCHNIGRHHRSNNIMLIADLQRGVWYQKCHDPDCHTQNYKSPEWPLPRDILPASYFDDDLDLEMDDNELLNTTVELEKQFLEQQTHSSGTMEFEDGDDDDLVAAVTDLDHSINLKHS